MKKGLYNVTIETKTNFNLNFRALLLVISIIFLNKLILNLDLILKICFKKEKKKHLNNFKFRKNNSLKYHGALCTVHVQYGRYMRVIRTKEMNNHFIMLASV